MCFGARATPEHDGEHRDGDRDLHRWWRVSLGAVIALAVLIRLPSLASTRWLYFDDGVYNASVLAMRRGGLPFRDVFSSQGPVFLPTLWFADLVGLHAARAARLAMVGSGVLMTVSTYLIARRVAPRGAALGAGALVALSGTALLAAGPIEADGLALALGTLALALAATPSRPSMARAATVGVVLGAALGVKSLYVLPAVVTVGWLMIPKDRRDRIVVIILAAAVTGLVVSLPWGLANVWDDYVAFQLAIPRRRDPADNLSLVTTTLLRLDRLVVAVVVLAVLTVVVRRVRGRGIAPPPHRLAPTDRVLTLAPVVWFVASAVVVIVLSEVNDGFLRYVAFLVPPLAVLAARSRPPLLVAALVVAVLLPSHLGALGEDVRVRRPSTLEAQAIRDLQDLARGKQVLSDEPGLAWSAGLAVPPNLVDPSYNRMAAGYLTSEEVRAET
ncbi:MAG: hypothetical protein ACKOA9_00585, partial [Actinomycetota bacterium]